MIKRFCDVCEVEISRNWISERLNAAATLRRGAHTRVVQINITAGIGKGHSNNGDICKECLFLAVKQLIGPQDEEEMG